jgi:hypothetical protein
MSNVRKILCHAEFPCPKCGEPFLSMALAPWDPIRNVMGDAELIGQDECGECRDVERKAERDAYDLARERAAWVRKNTPTGGPKPPGGRRKRKVV